MDEKRGIELERLVADWLKQLHPTLKYVRQTDRGGIRVDFLVISPIQLAIEVLGDLQPLHRFHKAKRLLAERVALSERYGPALPLVVVLPGKKGSEPTLPFVDKIIWAEHLPTWDDFIPSISLDPFTQRILRSGEPDQTALSSEDEIISRWRASITLEKVIFGVEHPVNSLANRIKISTDATVRGILQDQASTLHSLRGSRPTTDRLKTSLKLYRQIEECIQLYVTDHFGGEFREKTLPISDNQHHLRLRISVWEKGPKRVVFRTLFHSPSVAHHKEQELLADAWIARALTKPPINKLLLLLGWWETPDWNSEQGMLLQRSVSRFESAGWIVRPFDFTELEPKFLEVFREKSSEF